MGKHVERYMDANNQGKNLDYKKIDLNKMKPFKDLVQKSTESESNINDLTKRVAGLEIAFEEINKKLSQNVAKEEEKTKKDKE